KQEYPGRKIIKDQPVDPVAHEVLGISSLTAGRAQSAFDAGQRTHPAGDFLHAYECDGSEMCDPEPEHSSPLPSSHCTYCDQREAAHHKSYVCAMQHGHHVCK